MSFKPSERRTDVKPVVSTCIHYSFRAPVLKNVVPGVGACCAEGSVTCHPGSVTCPDCLEILKGA